MDKSGPNGLRPEPMGRIIPSLEGSYNYNHECTPEWLVFYCPSCGSDNVCCLNPKDFDYGYWFCIACNSSWTYVRDEDSWSKE